MKHLILLLTLVIGSFYLQAQDSTLVKADTAMLETAPATDTTSVEDLSEKSKMEKKVSELQQKIKEAMEKREKLRAEADASTEPEAYSKVATASIKITKLQRKLYYAQEKLNTTYKRAEKKSIKESKKKQEIP